MGDSRRRCPGARYTRYTGCRAQATPLNLRPRYNGCPTQDFTSVRLDGPERTAVKLRWGLVPSWAPDPRIGSRLINARAETVHERRAFRAAFKRRRCLIPADGWFEWRKEAGGEAAVVHHRGGPDTGVVRRPVGVLGARRRAAGDLHHPDHRRGAGAWRHPPPPAEHHRGGRLRGVAGPPDTPHGRLLALARRSTEGPFDCWPVSKRVNYPRIDDPDLLAPLAT